MNKELNVPYKNNFEWIVKNDISKGLNLIPSIKNKNLNKNKFKNLSNASNKDLGLNNDDDETNKISENEKVSFLNYCKNILNWKDFKNELKNSKFYTFLLVIDGEIENIFIDKIYIKNLILFDWFLIIVEDNKIYNFENNSINIFKDSNFSKSIKIDNEENISIIINKIIEKLQRNSNNNINKFYDDNKDFDKHCIKINKHLLKNNNYNMDDIVKINYLIWVKNEYIYELIDKSDFLSINDIITLIINKIKNMKFELKEIKLSNIDNLFKLIKDFNLIDNSEYKEKINYTQLFSKETKKYFCLYLNSKINWSRFLSKIKFKNDFNNKSFNNDSFLINFNDNVDLKRPWSPKMKNENIINLISKFDFSKENMYMLENFIKSNNTFIEASLILYLSNKNINDFKDSLLALLDFNNNEVSLINTIETDYRSKNKTECLEFNRHTGQDHLLINRKVLLEIDNLSSNSSKNLFSNDEFDSKYFDSTKKINLEKIKINLNLRDNEILLLNEFIVKDSDKSLEFSQILTKDSSTKDDILGYLEKILSENIGFEIKLSQLRSNQMKIYFKTFSKNLNKDWIINKIKILLNNDKNENQIFKNEYTIKTITNKINDINNRNPTNMKQINNLKLNIRKKDENKNLKNNYCQIYYQNKANISIMNNEIIYLFYNSKLNYIKNNNNKKKFFLKLKLVNINDFDTENFSKQNSNFKEEELQNYIKNLEKYLSSEIINFIRNKILSIRFSTIKLTDNEVQYIKNTSNEVDIYVENFFEDFLNHILSISFLDDYETNIKKIFDYINRLSLGAEKISIVSVQRKFKNIIFNTFSITVNFICNKLKLLPDNSTNKLNQEFLSENIILYGCFELFLLNSILIREY